MNTLHTLDAAQALLPEARRRARQGVELVAEHERLVRGIESGTAPSDAASELASLEAAVDALFLWFDEHGVQVKSLSPLLLDFPARAIREGEALDVLLCWREDEDAIAYYHPIDTGYRGREPVGLLDSV